MRQKDRAKHPKAKSKKQKAKSKFSIANTFSNQKTIEKMSARIIVSLSIFLIQAAHASSERVPLYLACKGDMKTDAFYGPQIRSYVLLIGELGLETVTSEDKTFKDCQSNNHEYFCAENSKLGSAEVHSNLTINRVTGKIFDFRYVEPELKNYSGQDFKGICEISSLKF